MGWMRSRAARTSRLLGAYRGDGDGGLTHFPPSPCGLLGSHRTTINPPSFCCELRPCRENPQPLRLAVHLEAATGSISTSSCCHRLARCAKGRSSAPGNKPRRETSPAAYRVRTASTTGSCGARLNARLAVSGSRSERTISREKRDPFAVAIAAFRSRCSSSRIHPAGCHPAPPGRFFFDISSGGGTTEASCVVTQFVLSIRS